MEVIPTLTEYALIHYKQLKKNTPKRMQDRLVVVLRPGKIEALVIKKLNFWERIRAHFSYGPAAKKNVLQLIEHATKASEHKASIDEKVRFIFSKELQHSDIPTILTSISECHNRSLIEEVITMPEIKANINANVKDGDTTLMLAIKNNNREAFDVLIHSEDIALNTANTMHDYTALVLAIELERLEFAKKLLAKGCNIPVKAFTLSKNNAPLLAAIKSASSEQKSALLVQAVEHSNTTAFKKIINEMHGLDTLPALERAIQDNSVEMVDILFGHGLNKIAALEVAVKQWVKGDTSEESEVFKKLVDFNRNSLHSGLAALAELHPGDSIRSQDEYLMLIHTFIARDEDMRINGEACYKVLTRAAERGNWNLVEALIRAGANPNFEPNGASKLLLRASSRAGPEVVRLLLAHGADINYQDARNTTALKRAELRLQHGHIPGGQEQAESVLDILKEDIEKTNS